MALCRFWSCLQQIQALKVALQKHSLVKDRQIYSAAYSLQVPDAYTKERMTGSEMNGK